MSIQPTIAPTVFEGIDEHADITCEGMTRDDQCDAPADLRVKSHTHPGWFVCRACWDADKDMVGQCRASRSLETRDQHCTLIEWLR